MTGSTPPIKPKSSSEPIQEIERIGELGEHEFKDLTGKEKNLANQVHPPNLYSERPLEHQVSPAPEEGIFWSIFGSLLAKIFSIFSNLFSFSTSSPKPNGPVDIKTSEEPGAFDKKEEMIHEVENHINTWQAQIKGFNQLPPDEKFSNLLRLYDTLEKEIPTLNFSQEQMVRLDTMQQSLKDELDRHLLDMKQKIEGQMTKEEMVSSLPNTFQEASFREKLQILQHEHNIKKEQAETLISKKEQQIKIQEGKIQTLESKKQAVETTSKQQSIQQKKDWETDAKTTAQEMFKKREEKELQIDLLKSEIQEMKKRENELVNKTNFFGRKSDLTPKEEKELQRIRARLSGFEQDVEEFNALPQTLEEATERAQKPINEKYEKQYQILSKEIDNYNIQISTAKAILSQSIAAKNEAEVAKRELETISQKLQQLANTLK